MPLKRPSRPAAKRKAPAQKRPTTRRTTRRKKNNNGWLFWLLVLILCSGVWAGIGLAKRYVTPEDKAPTTTNTEKTAPQRTAASRPKISQPKASQAPPNPAKNTQKTVPKKAIAPPTVSPKKVAKTPSLPRVAIVIDDVGENADSYGTTKLPPEVTLAFLPEGELTTELAPQAHANGHTILVHMPMAPKSQDYLAKAGKIVLKPSDAAFELRKKIGSQLEFLGLFASGVNNHMGSAFTENEAAMAVMLGELKKRDLFFLDSRTTANTKAEIANFGLNVPLLTRDVFLDHVPHPVAIEAQLKTLTKKAKQQGFAIAIGHTYPETTEAVARFAKNAKKYGIKLVKLDELFE